MCLSRKHSNRSINEKWNETFLWISIYHFDLVKIVIASKFHRPRYSLWSSVVSLSHFKCWIEKIQIYKKLTIGIGLNCECLAYGRLFFISVLHFKLYPEAAKAFYSILFSKSWMWYVQCRSTPTRTPLPKLVPTLTPT